MLAALQKYKREEIATFAGRTYYAYMLDDPLEQLKRLYQRAMVCLWACASLQQCFARSGCCIAANACLKFWSTCMRACSIPTYIPAQTGDKWEPGSMLQAAGFVAIQAEEVWQDGKRVLGRVEYGDDMLAAQVRTGQVPDAWARATMAGSRR